MNKKIAFICPYFGKLPDHCQLWLNSCEMNPAVTWFLITDDHRKFNYPSNVNVIYSTLEKTKAAFQEKLGFQISLEGVYKLGDYKPLFGYLYEELIDSYDAWGHIDVADEIYGDIAAFITDDLLDKYDKIMFFGHMAVYKNTPEVNRRFKRSSDIGVSYTEIFSSEKFYNFEEYAPISITRLYEKNKWPIARLDEAIADISGIYYRFRLAKISDDYNSIRYYQPKPLIFAWENGKVYGYSVVNGMLKKKEYLYVHFKRRKMCVNVPFDADRYLIVPNGFISFPAKIDKNDVLNNSKNKLIYDVYFKEKRKALVMRANKTKSKLLEFLPQKSKDLARYLPDKAYLQLKYFYIFKKTLNLRNPKTFNEKIQWLKLYNRNELYCIMVDKFRVKEYISDKLGADYIAKTYGIYDSFEEIDFDSLPDSFVIKTTHDSGGIVICKNKQSLDLGKAREKISNSLKTDFFILGREWPYKHVKHRIIVEEYLTDESGVELKDYKLFCFNGKVKFIQLDYDRFTDHHRNMYDAKWNRLPLTYTYPPDETKEFDRPKRLDEMISCAEIISNDIPFVRCDFYCLPEKVIFGEMTFFPESGFGKFSPKEYDYEFGQMIVLR